MTLDELIRKARFRSRAAFADDIRVASTTLFRYAKGQQPIPIIIIKYLKVIAEKNELLAKVKRLEKKD